jgi:hypothetical protein
MYLMPEDRQYDRPKRVACIDETNKNLLWLAVCIFQYLTASFLTRVDACLHINIICFEKNNKVRICMSV